MNCFRLLAITSCVVPACTLTAFATPDREAAARASTVVPIVSRRSAPDLRPQQAEADVAIEPLPVIPSLSDYEIVTVALPNGLPETWTADISINGALHVITMTRTSLRSPDCVVFIDVGGDELIPIESPPHRTYRGTIAGIPEGGVAVSLLEHGLAGFIDLGEERWYIQPASDLLPENAEDLRHVVYSANDVLFGDGFSCGVGAFNMALPDWALPDWMQVDGHGNDGGGGVAGLQPQVVEIGFDADFDFFEKNFNSVINTVNDIELVMNGVDFIYDRDVNIAYEFTTFVVRTTPGAPYTSNDMGTLLCQFRNNWNSAPENAIQRDVAQLYTGKSIQGSTIGLAWLGVICNQTGFDCGSGGNLAYNSVESRFSLILASRQALSAHELGHNWNASHCNGAASCHIMCASLGGCDGIGGSNLKFGPSESNQIIAFRNSVSCDTTTPLPLSPPFFDSFPNQSIDTTKWNYIDGATTVTSASNPPSSPRTLLLNSAGAGIYQVDEIRTNQILLGGLSLVTASYWTQASGVEAGEKLFVDYWSSGGDWINLNMIESDGVSQTAFTYWEHELPANARHDGFRLRFRVEVNETNDQWYVDDVAVTPITGSAPPNDECFTPTFVDVGQYEFNTFLATDSLGVVTAVCDEGNGTAFRRDIWYLIQPSCTGTLIVSTCNDATFDTRLAVYNALFGCPLSPTPPLACSDNTSGCANGTSTMEVPVTAGLPYYIRLGGATGGGTGTLTISCELVKADCPSDLDDDGVVNGADLGTLLAAWGSTTALATDINGDGVVDGADLGILLAAWGSCPN